MDRTALDLWVGIFVVAGLAALSVLALKVGNLSSYNMSETYQLQAYFSNVGGLKSQASIKSSGVLIGRVAMISLDPERYEAKVTMNIDKRYHLPKDTFANILTSGLLGEQYIGMIPGGDTELLKAGDEIKKTQSALVMEDLISKLLYSKADEPKQPTK